MSYRIRSEKHGAFRTPADADLDGRMTVDLRSIALTSLRLSLRSFTAADAAESFAATTPTLTRFMSWDPSPSLEAFADVWRAWLPRIASGTDLPLAIRLKTTAEFLGMAGLHHIGSPEPEIGIWIKEAAHGLGYGREAIAAIIAWAREKVGAAAFIYPVAVPNHPSRHLAESLGGALVGTRQLRKPSGMVLDEVVYRIPI
jgi:RimJ/RimL family protein N-acetyltransferase